MRIQGVLAAAVFIAGVTGLGAATDGFAVFTAEGARRAAVQQSPKAVPAVALEDQDGRFFSLADYGGRPVLVEFIFTRCADVCMELGDAFETVAADLKRERRGSEVALLSISFDPADTPEDLKDYGARFGADGRRWRVARPMSPEGRARLLWPSVSPSSPTRSAASSTTPPSTSWTAKAGSRGSWIIPLPPPS